MRFKGKTALVTGVARGIGAAIVRRLADEGAHVLAVDRLAFDSPATTPAGRIVPIQVDLAAADASAPLLAALDGRPLDILINNAGIGGSQPIWDTSDDDWDRYLNINLASVFRLSRDLLPAFTRPGACIVNMSSIFGLVGRPGNLAYAVSKAGIAQMTAQIAADLGPRGIRVNAIAPGVIDTELTHQRIHENRWYQQFMCDAIALRRNGTPEDISGVAAFLCSDDARYMTGQVLVVDGGWLTARYLPPVDDKGREEWL